MGVIRLLLAVAGALGAPAAAQSDTSLARPVAIAAGTELELMVLTEVTSSTPPGHAFKLRLNQPIRIGDEEIVPVGAAARGEVIDRRSSTIVMQRGRLAARITALRIGDVDLPLDTLVESQGRGGKGDDVAKLLLAPFYAPFARGNAAKLKAGELVRVKLVSDVHFQRAADGRWRIVPPPSSAPQLPVQP